ncbi:MAG: SDR family NAD(P)-dependent oxidoreductase [Actinomycetota bacterium]|nr:SDR family NAD(P)-dependent oxidoreductase [Actinomycetota bacterium]
MGNGGRPEQAHGAGRSAVVTGGAGGLGAPTVARLVADGFAVVVLDRRADPDTVIGVTTVIGDVLDDDDVTAAIDAATAAGELSVLVNAAGGSGPGAATVDGDGEPHDRVAFERTISSNVAGTFNVARLVAAAMARSTPDTDGQRGVIVNTASIAGYEGQRGQVAYAAAKAAILGMTLPMARDLAPVGIRVCAVAPGPMGTPAMLRLRDRLLEDPAAGVVHPPRMGRPDEFAALVGDIVANPYLNGENIRLDGALRLGAGPA